MLIPLREPESPRYIYINPETNRVHVLVPIVAGDEISSDNTCRFLAKQQEFFGDKGAKQELIAYKNALLFDIQLLENGSVARKNKEERLAQINIYIYAISKMEDNYAVAINQFLKKPGNLYAIQLRPVAQDHQSEVTNPVFTLIRENDREGTPLSPLFNAMHEKFKRITVARTDPRTRLITSVLNALPELPTFENIQDTLEKCCYELFDITIDFKTDSEGNTFTQDDIDSFLFITEDEDDDEEPPTTEDYVNLLLNNCASTLWVSLYTPPFYTISATPCSQRTEDISIMTQFLLAHINIHCISQKLSNENFGAVLDASPELSEALVTKVIDALESDKLEVETQICIFFNENATAFGLSRHLNTADLAKIKEKFAKNYQAVTSAVENTPMDDFMILDKDATVGELAKGVSHKGSMCVNFAEIVNHDLHHQDFFASIRDDFKRHPVDIPNKNESVETVLEIDIEHLLKKVSFEELLKFPSPVLETCKSNYQFLLLKFLDAVAKGMQSTAELLLNENKNQIQIFLRTPGNLTDFSKRTFNCTAYEYAYWAKDTYMRRMLEHHMDDDTKAILLQRIEYLEEPDESTGEPRGLMYQINGQTHRSAHFDFSTLKESYKNLINIIEASPSNNIEEKQNAWMFIGQAQRHVPAHVAQEYCREDRTFEPMPTFNELDFPRSLEFSSSFEPLNGTWFPLDSRDNLGNKFAFARGGIPGGCRALDSPSYELAYIDLTAIIMLDEIRTSDLAISRDYLLAKSDVRLESEQEANYTFNLSY